MSDLADVIEDIRTELAQMENLRRELNSLRDLHYAGGYPIFTAPCDCGCADL